MAEFERLKAEQAKKSKGISWYRRLTGKPFKGGPVMRKPLAITAGLAVGLIVGFFFRRRMVPLVYYR